MLRTAVNFYYQKRGLKAPGLEDAFLFLLSEVGELADALIKTRFTEFSGDGQDMLNDALVLGQFADGLASSRGGWLRNNDREKPPNAQHEIGDVLMMLERVAMALDAPDALTCMRAKFREKGVSDWPTQSSG